MCVMSLAQNYVFGRWKAFYKWQLSLLFITATFAIIIIVTVNITKKSLLIAYKQAVPVSSH